MRNETCGDCTYHTAAQQYRAERSQRTVPAALPKGHFIVELNPEIEAAVDAAMELCDRGKVEAARVQVNRLLLAHPENHLVCYAKGVLHAIQEEHEEAIKWFDKALAIYPYLVEAHFNKAVAYQKLLRLAPAVLAYRQVVALGDPNDLPARQARSFLDDLAVSIRRTEGVDLDSYIESESLFDHAFTRMAQGDWDGALSGFRASAAKNDRNAPIHGNMALCLAELGFKAQSLAELERALEIDPQYEPAMTNRAVIERMQEGIALNAGGFERIEYGIAKFLGRKASKP